MADKEKSWVDKILDLVKEKAEQSIEQAKDTLREIERLKRDRGKTKKSTDVYELDSEFYDKIKEKEGFETRPYYDLAKQNIDGEVGVLRIEEGVAGSLWGKFSKTAGLYRGQDIDKAFDLSMAKLTIGMGTTGDVYKAYTNGKELTRNTDPITEEMAKDMVRFYLEDVLKDLQQVAPNKVVFDEMALFFYNVGKGALHKKGKTKYMNEFAPTSEYKKKDVGMGASFQIGNPMSFYELMKQNHIYPMCRRITRWRSAGGKLNKGIIKRRDETVNRILKIYGGF